MIEVVKTDLSLKEHADALILLLNTYAEDYMGGGSPLSDYTRANLADSLRQRPGCHVFLAYDGRKPVGLAINFESFSTFACRPILNIHDIAVHPDHRGRGIARALLDATEAAAHELGCCKLTLEVLENNERAMQVYTKFGFQAYELDPAAGRALFFEKKLDDKS